VVCINQADVFHRKRAIKNMDNIYRRAKKIIAVPDLCYNSKKARTGHFSNSDINHTLFQLTDTARRWRDSRPLEEVFPSKLLKLARFLRDIFKEWAERCWVISERTIGVKQDKLDVIILRENGAEMEVEQLCYYLKIDWCINFDQDSVISAILYSESTKYVDRLYAILPHTKYKDTLLKFVDDGQAIDNMTDLKMTLCDILDIEGRMLLLDHCLGFSREFQHVELSFPEDGKFQLPVSDGTDVKYLATVERTLHKGKHALKVSGPYTVRSPSEIEVQSYMLYEKVVESVVDIVLFRDQFIPPYHILRCARSNDVWMVDDFVQGEDVSHQTFKHGVFVFF
ncbi:hypothetical protein EC973_005762, partial [Apophysomyces ossiformis]